MNDDHFQPPMVYRWSKIVADCTILEGTITTVTMIDQILAEEKLSKIDANQPVVLRIPFWHPCKPQATVGSMVYAKPHS